MKNLALTLISIVAGLLPFRYHPFMSGKLLLEYVKSAFQSCQGRNLVNGNNAKCK